MRRLVFVTQVLDPDHPALGATVEKVHALAARLDEVTVICDTAVEGALPPNCRVRTFGAGTRLGRGLGFEGALARELRPRPVAVLAHMVPLYAVLAAPLTRPLRIPLLLWYTHWKATRTLRIAERVATRVVSVDRRSFPLDSKKIVATGHGIDVTAIPCTEHVPGLRLVALGRYSPAKGLATVLRAVAQVDAATLTVHGPTLTEEERLHRADLERLVRDLGIGSRVELDGPVPRSRVPAVLGAADALVNNMRAGAPDKVVYEAAAACLPVLASNPVFDELLPPELRFDRDDPGSLTERLRLLPALDPGIGHELRRRVEREHSVEHWAERILEAAT